MPWITTTSATPPRGLPTERLRIRPNAVSRSARRRSVGNETSSSRIPHGRGSRGPVWPPPLPACASSALLVGSRQAAQHASRPGRRRETIVATTIAGMDRQTAARALGGAGAAFGVLSVLAPRAVAAGYGVPPTPQGLQLQRLFGSRALAL